MACRAISRHEKGTGEVLCGTAAVGRHRHTMNGVRTVNGGRITEGQRACTANGATATLAATVAV
eukprot:scaffold105557_cov39-Tisochrysis_lutea.AAC.2